MALVVSIVANIQGFLISLAWQELIIRFSDIYIILDRLEWNTKNIAKVRSKYRTNKGRGYKCDILL